VSDLPAKVPADPSVGTILRRLFWRREAGPVLAEAGLEIRELLPNSDPGVTEEEADVIEE
jgi:hypothetical protein